MTGKDSLEWADAALSGEIVMIAAAGETQGVEFKAEIPKQVSNLAKEIAGFATSNAGRIVIGIDDDGRISGLDAMAQKSRAKLVERIEGLCANSVRPAITPGIKFAVYAGKVVMVIEVPKGSAPIYYSANIPYLRQITATRPLTPEEVVDHILNWDKARNGNSAQTAESRYLSDLASFLVDADVDARETRIRQLNPWAEMLRSSAGYMAGRARELAASAPDGLGDTYELLHQIADAFDIVAHEHPAINRSRAPIYEAIDTIVEAVAAMRARWLPPERFNEITENNQQEQVTIISRQLCGLAGRATDSERTLRIADVLEEASKLGDTLARIASLGVGLGGPNRADVLRKIAEALRELETRRIPMDGGQSIRRIVADIISLSTALESYVTDISQYRR